jgi:hypothetical protein
MKQRRVSFAQAIHCLQKGTVREPAALNQFEIRAQGQEGIGPTP